jgi:hypothetical protein
MKKKYAGLGLCELRQLSQLRRLQQHCWCREHCPQASRVPAEHDGKSHARNHRCGQKTTLHRQGELPADALLSRQTGGSHRKQALLNQAGSQAVRNSGRMENFRRRLAAAAEPPCCPTPGSSCSQHSRRHARPGLCSPSFLHKLSSPCAKTPVHLKSPHPHAGPAHRLERDGACRQRQAR